MRLYIYKLCVPGQKKKYLVTAPTFFKIQAISPIFIFTQVNQDELHWKEQKYTKLLKFTSIPSYYIVQYHRVETNMGVVCQSIHSSISISISVKLPFWYYIY